MDLKKMGRIEAVMIAEYAELAQSYMTQLFSCMVSLFNMLFAALLRRRKAFPRSKLHPKERI
jgi:hypothetical protein